MVMTRSVSRFLLALFLFAGGFVVARPAAAWQQTDETGELAAHLIEMTGMTRGICAVLGWDDDEFVPQVAQSGEHAGAKPPRCLGATGSHGALVSGRACRGVPLIHSRSACQ